MGYKIDYDDFSPTSTFPPFYMPPEKPRRTIGRILSERRRSNAAGKHGKRARDRRNTERQAVQRDIDASS